LDIFSVAVTAGYICYKPREAFFKYIDAANVDLKAFSQRFYKQLCGADFVLDTVRYLKHETQVWFELTSLFIPGENETDLQLHKMTEWLTSSQICPFILLLFTPDWKM
jgi:pyruvate formate lyase activating enzyme